MNPRVLWLPAILMSISAGSQTLCATANEGGTVVLNTPPGNYFTSVTFASYGTPNGSCGSFTIGGCHAANSMSIVQAAVVGNSSVSISATNGVFGDPCGGTPKRLYVEATYSALLPLKLLSFSGVPAQNGIALQWETMDEMNTRDFEIEYSNNGSTFTMVWKVEAKKTGGKNAYFFLDSGMAPAISYYRLKMVDQDEKYTYSDVIKIESKEAFQLNAFPNPVSNVLTMSGLRSGIIEISSITGKVLHRAKVSSPTKTISLSRYRPGIYIVKYSNDKETVTRRVVKL